MARMRAFGKCLLIAPQITHNASSGVRTYRTIGAVIGALVCLPFASRVCVLTCNPSGVLFARANGHAGSLPTTMLLAPEWSDRGGGERNKKQGLALHQYLEEEVLLPSSRLCPATCLPGPGGFPCSTPSRRHSHYMPPPLCPFVRPPPCGGCCAARART